MIICHDGNEKNSNIDVKLKGWKWWLPTKIPAEIPVCGSLRNLQLWNRKRKTDYARSFRSTIPQPRCGGKSMKMSAHYPDEFVRFVADHHLGSVAWLFLVCLFGILANMALSKNRKLWLTLSSSELLLDEDGQFVLKVGWKWYCLTRSIN